MKKLNALPKVTFEYHGKNLSGHDVKGIIMSAHISVAKAELRKQGINVTRISRQTQTLFHKKMTAEDITMFTRQFATLFDAGIPIVQSLEFILRATKNTRLKALLMLVKGEVEAGHLLSEAFSKHPRHFDDLYCHFMAIGEQSGTLALMLNRIAEHREKTEDLKRKIKKALFYPSIVIIVAMVVTSILLLFVVPQFQEIFKNFHAPLPTFTLLLLYISDVCRQWWTLFLSTTLAAGYAFFYFYRRSAPFHRRVSQYLLHIPLLGSLGQKAIVVRFCRTLSITYGAGIPLIESLETIQGATGNIIYQQAVQRIHDTVKTGISLHTAMQESGLFPEMLTQMVSIGEESGALDKMLNKAATIYETEVDLMVEGLQSLLEPLMMIILGILIGGLVIAMYLPILQLGFIV